MRRLKCDDLKGYSLDFYLCCHEKVEEDHMDEDDAIAICEVTYG